MIYICWATGIWRFTLFQFVSPEYISYTKNLPAVSKRNSQNPVRVCTFIKSFTTRIAGYVKVVNLFLWAKAVRKKLAKEASNIFHNIMQAFVSGNPKLNPKKKSANKKMNPIYLIDYPLISIRKHLLMWMNI